MSEGSRRNCVDVLMTKAVRTEMNSATYGVLNKCIMSCALNTVTYKNENYINDFVPLFDHAFIE